MYSVQEMDEVLVSLFKFKHSKRKNYLNHHSNSGPFHAHDKLRYEIVLHKKEKELK